MNSTLFLIGLCSVGALTFALLDAILLWSLYQVVKIIWWTITEDRRP